MSTRYVAFLRAINVGGHAVITMADLKTVFATAGCKNVRTYIQSGNVLFDVAARSAPAVFRRIRRGLRARLGHEPAIAFRTIEELESIVLGAPFRRFEREKKAKLYVAFLAEAPTVLPTLPLTSEKDAVEAIAFSDLNVFLVSRQLKNGFYGFPNALIEKAFGVSGTSRNWTTVTKIVALAADRP